MRKRIVSFVLIVCTLFAASSTAGAATDASKYLDAYTISLYAEGNGRMRVGMTVDGVYQMQQIGVHEMFIEEKNSSTGTWHEFATYYGTDDKERFYDFNSYFYMRTLRFNGVAGRYYRVTLQVFAGDKTGSDTGWITSATIRCK